MQPSTRLKPRHFPDCSFRFWFLNVEVALLSELEFKHQVTTAWGGGGREAGEGGMRRLGCRGVQRTGSGMEGGEGEV